jgi:hypothetical protein
MGTDQHVERQGSRWIVRSADGRGPITVFLSRLAAIEAGRRLARVAGGALVIHR